MAMPYGTDAVGKGKGTGNKTIEPPKNTGGNRGGSGNSSSYSFSFDPNQYINAFKSIYDQRNNQYQSYLDQYRQAAQNAYNNNINAINNAVSSRKGNLEAGYNSARGTLKRQYDQSVSDINKDAERALRESWVNKRMTEKSLPQNLAAQGISGGASESTLARLNTDYGNSRNAVNTTRNDNLTEVGGLYQDSLASLEQQYNDALSSLEEWASQMKMQAENNLAQGIASSYDMSGFAQNDQAYYDAYANIINNMMDYNFDVAKATNSLTPLSLSALNDMGSSTNYSKYQSFIEQQRAAGVDDNSIIIQLSQEGVPNNIIAEMMG